MEKSWRDSNDDDKSLRLWVAHSLLDSTQWKFISLTRFECERPAITRQRLQRRRAKKILQAALSTSSRMQVVIPGTIFDAWPRAKNASPTGGGGSSSSKCIQFSWLLLTLVVYRMPFRWTFLFLVFLPCWCDNVGNDVELHGCDWSKSIIIICRWRCCGGIIISERLSSSLDVYQSSFLTCTVMSVTHVHHIYLYSYCSV